MIHIRFTHDGLEQPVLSASDLDILDGGASCGALLPRQPVVPNDHAAVVPELARELEDAVDRIRLQRPRNRTTLPFRRPSATGQSGHARKAAQVTAPARRLPRAAPPPVRLVIVDDHELARAGLRSLLAAESQLEVVGEAASGREALALCRRLRPDVAIMDVRMPDLDGLAATRALKQEQPVLHVILITMHESPDYLLEALRAGASGYLLKGATRQTVLRSVRQVLRGKAALNPDVAAQLVRQTAVGRNGNAASNTDARLAAREQEILRLLTQGRSAHSQPSGRPS